MKPKNAQTKTAFPFFSHISYYTRIYIAVDNQFFRSIIDSNSQISIGKVSILANKFVDVFEVVSLKRWFRTRWESCLISIIFVHSLVWTKLERTSCSWIQPRFFVQNNISYSIEKNQYIKYINIFIVWSMFKLKTGLLWTLCPSGHQTVNSIALDSMENFAYSMS